MKECPVGAQMLYNALLENNCSEQASRMAAMESSTKNASEMLAKLTLTYNRCIACPAAMRLWA
jgi:F0F1-type ATP synthase gamma subunit